MEGSKFYWDSYDGLKMFGEKWLPANKNKIQGVIILVHGLGEHCDRYTELVDYLIKHDYAILAFDLRGHGRSQGSRGYAPSYNALMEDIKVFLDLNRNKFPKRDIFLYGHSLGGNLVLNYALRHHPNVKGLIVTSPWLKLNVNPSGPKLVLIRLINKVFSSFKQISGLKAEALSHNQDVIDAYIKDPLVHNKISARLFVSAFEAGHWALDNGKRMSMPLLLMHGSKDQITSPDASKEFAANVGKDCTLKIWDGLYHELHNELNNIEVFDFTLKWLRSTCVLPNDSTS